MSFAESSACAAVRGQSASAVSPCFLVWLLRRRNSGPEPIELHWAEGRHHAQDAQLPHDVSWGFVLYGGGVCSAGDLDLVGPFGVYGESGSPGVRRGVDGF